MQCIYDYQIVYEVEKIQHIKLTYQEYLNIRLI